MQFSQLIVVEKQLLQVFDLIKGGHFDAAQIVRLQTDLFHVDIGEHVIIDGRYVIVRKVERIPAHVVR